MSPSISKMMASIGILHQLSKYWGAWGAHPRPRTQIDGQIDESQETFPSLSERRLLRIDPPRVIRTGIHSSNPLFRLHYLHGPSRFGRTPKAGGNPANLFCSAGKRPPREVCMPRLRRG